MSETADTLVQESTVIEPMLKGWPNYDAAKHVEAKYGITAEGILDWVPMLTVFDGSCQVTEHFNDNNGLFDITLSFSSDEFGEIKIRIVRDDLEENYRIEETGFDTLKYNDPNIRSVNPRELRPGDVIHLQTASETNNKNNFQVLRHTEDGIVLGQHADMPMYAGKIIPILLGQRAKIISTETKMPTVDTSKVTQIMVIPFEESEYEMPQA